MTNASGSVACIVPPITETPIKISATVPGELVSDLQRAGLTADPFLDNTYKNASLWAGPVWAYTKRFTVAAGSGSGSDAVLLVLDGIKMGAVVKLNGVALGNTTNQHRRWIYELPAGLLGAAGGDELTVVFDDSITTEGRYMDCSGGWDWAPYSYVRDGDGNPAFTKGIWKVRLPVTRSHGHHPLA